MTDWSRDDSLTHLLGRRVEWRYVEDRSSFEYRIEGRSERFWNSHADYMKIVSDSADVLASRIQTYLAGKENT